MAPQDKQKNARTRSGPPVILVWLCAALMTLAPGCAKKKKKQKPNTTQATEQPAPGTGGSTPPSTIVPNLSFTCIPDRENTNEAPMFVPPFDVTDLHHKPTSPDFPFDANCDWQNDLMCNPGEAIEPVGGLYMPATGVGHLKPTPHMYISMKKDGETTIKSPAAGHVTMIVRSPNNEFGAQILHTCSLYTWWDNLSALQNAKLTALLDAVKPDWNAEGSSWTINFGRAAEQVTGEQITISSVVALEEGEAWATKVTSFGHEHIELRTIDKRVKRGAIINPNTRSWSLDHFFGDIWELQHAQPFMNYFSNNQKKLWLRFLRISPSFKPPYVNTHDVDAGSAAKDIERTLQGLWFNPTIYSYTTEADGFANSEYTEAAVLTIFERVGDPSKAHLAYGLNGSWTNTDDFIVTLPKLDPSLWPPCTCDEAQPACVDSCHLEQKRLSSYTSYFRGSYPRLNISNPGTTWNLSPLDVTPEKGTVCWDIDVDQATTWDRIYIKMETANRISVKYFPIRTAAPECSSHPTIDMSAHAHVFVRGEGE
jgi:hypothetical protein